MWNKDHPKNKGKSRKRAVNNVVGNKKGDIKGNEKGEGKVKQQRKVVIWPLPMLEREVVVEELCSDTDGNVTTIGKETSDNLFEEENHYQWGQ